MPRRYSLGILLSLAWAACVGADSPYGPQHSFWGGWGRVCPSIGCCPNDYMRKPPPPIFPFPCCGGVDDYCRKPLPCPPPVPCGGVDDYCRKPLPTLLCPPCSPFLQCGPAPCFVPNGK